MHDAPPLDASKIYSLQLMLSKFEYDEKLNPAFKGDGAFELPVESIRAVSTSGADTAKWVHISSAGVTRPNRPGINVEVEPPAVKLNDALGGLLTFKLKGEDAVRESGVPFAIIRPVALTEARHRPRPCAQPLRCDYALRAGSTMPPPRYNGLPASLHPSKTRLKKPSIPSTLPRVCLLSSDSFFFSFALFPNPRRNPRGPLC